MAKMKQVKLLIILLIFLMLLYYISSNLSISEFTVVRMGAKPSLSKGEMDIVAKVLKFRFGAGPHSYIKQEDGDILVFMKGKPRDEKDVINIITSALKNPGLAFKLGENEVLRGEDIRDIRSNEDQLSLILKEGRIESFNSELKKTEDQDLKLYIAGEESMTIPISSVKVDKTRTRVMINADKYEIRSLEIIAWSGMELPEMQIKEVSKQKRFVWKHYHPIL